MFANLKPYPEYEPAAHGSLPELPVSWSVSKLKRLIDLRGGATPAKERADFWDGRVPWVTPKDMKVSVICDSIDHVTDTALRETTLSPVEPGAVLIVVRGMILARKVPTAYVAAPVTINQDMKALVPGPLLDGAYLQALLVGQESLVSAIVEVSGHGTRKIDSDNLVNLHIPVPPHADQHAIIRYLAHANGRIDRAIAAKRKMIALLEEQKQAIAYHAVTSGLDQGVQVKEPGAHWLEEIPQRWQVRKLKYLTNARGGMTPSKNRADYWDGIIPWVSPKEMKVAEIADTSDHVSHLALQETGIAMVPPGAVLMVVRGMILQRRVPIALTTMPVTINQDMKALVPQELVSPVYLQLLLTSVNHHLRRLVTVAGHGTRKLETEVWGNQRLPIPPVEEQDRIINHVKEELCHAGLATRKLIGEIELLQEFKTRLTADVVTGQIDVREIAATLPEIDPAEAAESVSADVDDELDEFASDALEDAEP